MTSGKRRTETIQSIERAISILRSFTEAEPELRVTELAQRLDLHKSTVSRILGTLEQEGLVGQNRETGKYRLGLGLVSLAGVALGRLDVRGAAQPHLDDLVELSQETVNVTVLDGPECVTIERVASPRPIRYMGWIGRRTPIHCTAAGKVLVASLSPENRQALLPQPLHCFTERTVVDMKELEEELDAIAEQGYAIVEEEFEEGFSAIAAPVHDHGRLAVGAISIAGPAYRLEGERLQTLIEPLIAVTRRISADLGYLPVS